jgi:hypothetical protein
MRDEVRRLIELGPLPDESAPLEAFQRVEKALHAITPPPSPEEARALVRLFGPDDCYGMAWTLLHLVEKTPGWPLWDCLDDTSNEWIQDLRDRAERAGFSPPDTP